MLKEYLGSAPATTLSANLTDSATSLTVTNANGWPTGSVAPFVVSIEQAGTVEKLLCASRAGTTLTVTTRGYDGTVALAFTSGAVVKHVVDALMLQETNNILNGAAALQSKLKFGGDSGFLAGDKGSIYNKASDGMVLHLPDGTTYDWTVLSPGGSNILTVALDQLGVKFYAPIDAPVVGARAYHSTTQSLNNATTTTISLNTENWDTNVLHDTVTNNNRLTIPAGMGGKYIVTGQIVYANNGTGGRYIALRVNGSAHTNKWEQPQAAQAHGVTLTDIMNLSAGDYVDMAGHQTSGGALNVEGNSANTFLAIARIGT